jgi:multidrug efflux pump
MTSIAFIAGTVPLLFASGAGSEVRVVTGVTVFAGMLGVTLFGLFLTPVFYVALRRFVEWRRGREVQGAGGGTALPGSIPVEVGHG